MLAYFLDDFDPFIFHIWGGFGPRWYGLAYVLAFACGFWLLRVLAERGYTELRIEQVGDFITWGALFGVMLGGRLGYVLFYQPEMLREPLSIFAVWEGGMSSHGGMLGLIAFTFWYSWRHKISWTNLGDNLVVVAPIGLFFGRCANFINGELYGRLTNVRWAMLFPKEILDPQNGAEAERALAVAQQIDPSLTSPETVVNALQSHPLLREKMRLILTPRHPSQIYEALLEGVLLFLDSLACPHADPPARRCPHRLVFRLLRDLPDRRGIFSRTGRFAHRGLHSRAIFFLLSHRDRAGLYHHGKDPRSPRLANLSHRNVGASFRVMGTAALLSGEDGVSLRRSVQSAPNCAGFSLTKKLFAVPRAQGPWARLAQARQATSPSSPDEMATHP